MSEGMLPDGPGPDDDLVKAIPWARELAGMIARIRRVRSAAIIEDCRQVACQTLLERRPRYDKTRGPFQVFMWKPVVGAVTRFLRRERAAGRTGLDDALEEVEGFQDASDPFSANDGDDMATLKAWCRVLTFRKVMGDTRVALHAGPENEALRAQVFQALRAAVGGLEERHMRLIHLRYWQELTWPEIGEQMAVSERQVKRIDKEIRDLLEGDLRSRGVEEAPPSAAP